jgi:hypothetical protein
MGFTRPVAKGPGGCTPPGTLGTVVVVGGVPTTGWVVCGGRVSTLSISVPTGRSGFVIEP